MAVGDSNYDELLAQSSHRIIGSIALRSTVSSPGRRAAKPIREGGEV